ncbi:MAG TPA: hypothetical protein VEG39_06850 [Clostridia bacterium]|nr:hypothetical protein [Clostridia bacterium]
MSILIFAGTVIDIVRIAAADRKVQSALNSSARSVLAGYDKELAGSYGIYGINTASDAVNDDFYRYISVNLKERHEGISFLDIKVDREDVQIQAINGLLDDEAFKKQVQEYMKYRAPITISESLGEQLKNIKLDKKVDFAKGEKATRDKARELRTKVNEVNSRLEGIKKKVKDLSAEKLEEIKKELSEASTASSLIYGENGEGLLDEYNDCKEDTNNKAEEGECIENQSLEFAYIQENSENLAPGLQSWLVEVNKTLKIITPLQKELKSLEEELSDLKEELSDLKEELSDIKEDNGSSSEEEDDIEDEIDEVKEDIDNIESKIKDLKLGIEEEMSGLRRRLAGISLEGYTLKEEAIQLADKKIGEIKKLIDQMKKEIEGSLFRSLEEDWLIGAEEFNRSSLIMGEDFGLMDDKAHYSTAVHEEEAEKSNDTIVRSMEKLSKAIEDAASGAAEKVNTIEYIMDKFTFLTSRTERVHYFRKGEVEYIISGSDTAKGISRLRNTEYYIVTNVLLQVWALRFAIDTIDNFVRSAVIFPPQRLVFALAEGALDSALDIYNMLNGEAVPICPKSFTAVKLKYSDHLKILLLMKPEEEILRKARQLMQVNIKQLIDAETKLSRTNFRLGDYSTVISASVTAKVNLFFLPLLKVDRLLPGSFEEGRYMIRKQIHVGY